MVEDYIGDDNINWSEHARSEALKGWWDVHDDTGAFDYFGFYLQPNDTVLELGCNIGRWADVFRKYHVNYIGVDASETAIELARKHFESSNKHVHFYCIQAGFISKYRDRIMTLMHSSFTTEPSPLGDPIALVFTNTVLQHMHYTTKQTALKDIHTVLEPKGYLVIQEVIDGTNERAFTYQGWIDFITSFGFEFLTSTKPDDPRHGFVFQKV